MNEQQKQLGKEVAQFIRENPQGFQMKYLFANCEGTFNYCPSGTVDSVIEAIKAGKLRACIAAITCLFSEVHPSLATSSKARNFLGLSSTQIFYLCDWGIYARNRYENLLTDAERANFAADYLEKALASA